MGGWLLSSLPNKVAFQSQINACALFLFQSTVKSCARYYDLVDQLNCSIYSQPPQSSLSSLNTSIAANSTTKVLLTSNFECPLSDWLWISLKILNKLGGRRGT